MRARARALRIVSVDKILLFTNTLIIIIPSPLLPGITSSGRLTALWETGSAQLLNNTPARGNVLVTTRKNGNAA